MELTLDPGDASYRIASYQTGQVALWIKNSEGQTEKKDYLLPLVITREKLIHPFTPDTFPELKTEDLQALLPALGFKPEVILLGTGESNLLLHPELYAALAKENIGIEPMTTAAACRTYTVLMSEARNVVAILF